MHPTLFKIGNYPVHAWGLMLMFAFLLATWRGSKSAYSYKVDPQVIWDCALYGLIGGVLGGRLAYVIQQPSYFIGHPLEIFAMWQGGSTSFGGFIGGLWAGIATARKRGIALGDAADIAAIGLPLGYVVGRIGCFLNGCCFGTHCTLPWGVNLPDTAETVGINPVHPVPIYSAICGLIIYGILHVLEPKKRVPGQLLAMFAILYGIYRFGVEFIREGVTAKVQFGVLTTGQYASIAVALVGLGAYLLLAKRGKKTAA